MVYFIARVEYVIFTQMKFILTLNTSIFSFLKMIRALSNLIIVMQGFHKHLTQKKNSQTEQGFVITQKLVLRGTHDTLPTVGLIWWPIPLGEPCNQIVKSYF